MPRKAVSLLKLSTYISREDNGRSERINMKILSWNVNGIRAAQRKGFVDWVACTDADMILIQETKAHPDQLDEKLLQIDDYRAYFSSAEKKGYSGVALYTRTQPNDIRYGFGILKFDNEGRTIIAEYDRFVLMNIYYPNGQMRQERLDYKMDFYDAFLEYADALKRSGKQLVIGGDFNTAHREIDLARPKENENISGFLPIERAWIDKFISHGYVDTFREFHPEPDQYTWWSVRTRAREKNIGWRIDYFFVNEDFRDHVTDAFIIPGDEGSDHCPLGIEIST